MGCGGNIGAAWLAVCIAFVGSALSGSTPVPVRNSDCLDCHADKTLTRTNAAGKEVSLFVDADRLNASVHKTNACVSCHSDITAKHPDDNRPAEPVRCAICHQKQASSYSASVHGLAVLQGDAAAATCQDCHGSHDIMPPTSPASPLHFVRQAETCGKCHDQEARDVAQSMHGQATAAGARDAPTCTDCHAEHKIESLKSSAPLANSSEVCSRCHASERLNTKYNLPHDRVETYFNSYHGLAARYGSTVAANCGSCHGYHKILPSSDPGSTINPRHLVQTCGKCHPGATEKFALGKVHFDASAASATNVFGQEVNWWVRRIYLGLIGITIGVMLLHNGLHFLKKVRARYRAADLTVPRMNFSQRVQHALLAGSFIVLAISGFALKFPNSWLALLLGSNELTRRWIHRVAGVLLLAVGAWHILYVMLTRDGRRLLHDLSPGKKDAQDLAGSARYLAGLSSGKPKFARFGYAEKMEYWAVVWGTIIMGGTGLAIWLKMDVTRFLPRWAVDVSITVHYYEAILAGLAILVWHFYHVIFDPDVYPLNWACWNGKVSRHWHEEEHPLDKPGPDVPAPRGVISPPLAKVAVEINSTPPENPGGVPASNISSRK